MAKKVTIEGSNLIDSLSDDWGGRNNTSSGVTIHGTYVPAGAEWGMNRGEVERYLKEALGARVGEFYFDSNANRYLCFTDEEARDLYLLDPINNNSLLLASFEAPFNYAAHITIENTYVSILNGETGNFLEYTFGIVNKENQPVDDNVNVTYTFSNGGVKRSVNASYAAGANVRFLIDEYLRTGENRITISLTGASTLAATSVLVTYFVVDLSLSSTFDFGTPRSSTETINVPYTISGIGLKAIECYIDNGSSPVYTKTGIAENTSNSQFSVNLSSLTGLGAGRHYLQLRAYLTVGSSVYFSKTMFFHFKVTGDNTPCFLFSKELGIGELNTTGTLPLECEQFEEMSLNWAYYHPTATQATVTVTTPEGSTSVQATTGSIYTFYYQPLDAGDNQEIVFSATGCSETLYIDVEGSDLGISEVTENILVRLVALGRSNSETSTERNKWRYNNTNYATFTNFEWTAQSGWDGEALVVKKGTTATINVKPFSGLTSSALNSRGVTIDIDFETDNVDNESATVISCFSNSMGFKCTATGALLTTQNGVTVETKFKPRDRQRICLTMHSHIGEEQNLLTIVNNGLLERASSYDSTDSLNLTGTNITIGSSYATVKVYSIRVYSNDLTTDQCFGNYAVGSNNRREIVAANDVLDSGSIVSYEKVRGMIPTFLFTVRSGYSMSTIINAQSKNDYIYCDVDYHNPQDPTYDFTITHAYVCPQGTSSLAYPIKNLRLYTKESKATSECKMYDAQGSLLSGGKYSFKQGAQPVNVWTLKADYAESSMSHNTGTAKLWNDIMKNVQLSNKYVCRSRAMAAAINSNYQYDVRMAIDGFPCCVFYRDGANGQVIFMGQFNFDNDKSTESVFGFTGVNGNFQDDFGTTFGSFEDDIECWESLANANDICLFKSNNFYAQVSIDGEMKPAWEGAFEARYPDVGSNAVTTHLKALSDWLVGLKNLTTANRTAFATQKWDHLDVYKVAAYYIYAMRHGAVDQLVKNSMLTTEGYKSWKRTVTTTTVGGQTQTTVTIEPHTSSSKIYYFQWYDNDTIHGINNDSRICISPYTDRTSYEEGSSTTRAYAGYDSTLWNLLEGDDEFMGIVQELDQAIGLTYERCCQIYDVSQSAVWPARLYNNSGKYKYIEHPGRLYMLQGSRESHRHWWLKTRMDLYDSRFVSGDFRNNVVTFKVNAASSGDTSTYTFTITSGDRLYYGYGINNSVEEMTSNVVNAGGTATFTPRALVIGDPVKIFGSSHLAGIDLSPYAARLDSIILDHVNDAESGSRLKKLILGASGKTNNRMTGLDLQGNGVVYTPQLEELDITGFTGFVSINGLSEMKQLKKLRAGNSGLTTVTLAEGVSMTQLVLPTTLQQLYLTRAKFASESLTYTPSASLLTLSATSCTGLDTLSIVQTWVTAVGAGSYASRTLNLDNVEWQGVTAQWLYELASKSWMSFSLKGHVQVTGVDATLYDQLKGIFGQDCFLPSAELYIEATAGIVISAPTVLMEGESVQLTAMIFPEPETAPTYTWSIIEGSRTGVTLSSTGYLQTVENGAATVNFRVRAYCEIGSDVYIGTAQIQVRKCVYPTLSQTSIVETAVSSTVKKYHLSFSVETYCKLKNTWSLSGDITNYGSFVADADGMGGTLTLSQSVPAYTKGTLNCAMSKNTNVSIGTKTTDVEYKDATVAFSDISNHYLMALMYSKGYAIHSDYMLKSECALVTESQLQPGTSYSTSIFYANSSFRTNCTHLEELQYFTSLSTLPTYLLYSCNVETVILPSSITSIGNYAFNLCSRLSSVTMPSSLRTIGMYAFSGCTSLSELNIPEGVTSIGSYAFRESGLTSIVIPNTVTGTSSQWFYDCNSLRTVTLSNKLTSWGERICYSCDALETVTVTGSSLATSIDTYAFYGCSKLSSISFPGGLVSIGGYAFNSCPKITDVTFPSTLTTIGAYAFYASYITSLSIPASVSSIANTSFDYNRLENITVSNGNATYDSRNNCNAIIKTSSNELVIGCKNTVIPNTVTRIGSHAFSGCSGVSEITIPDSVNAIGAQAFQGSSIERISIPSGVTALEEDTFRGCHNLYDITIPDTVTTIGAYVFYGNSSLTSINLPSYLTQIGNNAFSLSALTSITIPNTVTTLGTNIFSSCTGLTTANISNGLSSIASGTFTGCTSLSSVSIPSSIIEISSYAFSQTVLTEIVIPNNVTTIGASAFRNCSSLTNVTIGTSVGSIGQNAFSGSGYLTVKLLGRIPPSLGASAFSTSSLRIFVPYPHEDVYKGDSTWSSYSAYIQNDFTPSSITSLSIVGEDFSGRDTQTNIVATPVMNGTSNITGSSVTGYTATIYDVVTGLGQNPSTENSRTVTLTYTYMGLTATTSVTQFPYVNSYYSVDLNSQWMESQETPDQTLYKCYESFSNYHVANGVATMYITIFGFSSFTVYIRSNGESNFDYVQISQLDQTPVPGNYNSTTTKAYTRSSPSSSYSLISNWIEVNYTVEEDDDEHVITVIYRKDSSGDSGTDKGYILIPKNQ